MVSLTNSTLAAPITGELSSVSNEFASTPKDTAGKPSEPLASSSSSSGSSVEMKEAFHVRSGIAREVPVDSALVDAKKAENITKPYINALLKEPKYSFEGSNNIFLNFLTNPGTQERPREQLHGPNGAVKRLSEDEHAVFTYAVEQIKENIRREFVLCAFIPGFDEALQLLAEVMISDKAKEITQAMNKAIPQFALSLVKKSQLD